MRNNIIIIFLLSIGLLGSVYLCTRPQKLPYLLPFFQYNSESKVIEKFNAPLANFHQVGYFSFINQLGDTINSSMLDSNIYVADYFFVTCPGICKAMGVQMQRVYREFKDVPQVKLVSLTSKPEEDSLPVLKAYADRMGVDNHQKWLFLLGTRRSLYDLAKNQFFIVDETSESDFVHTERFVLIDKARYIRGYYDGTDSKQVDQLIKDIKLLQQEGK